jgi:hypothetical protein
VLTEPIVITILLLLLLLYNIENTTHAGCITILNKKKHNSCSDGQEIPPFYEPEGALPQPDQYIPHPHSLFLRSKVNLILSPISISPKRFLTPSSHTERNSVCMSHFTHHVYYMFCHSIFILLLSQHCMKY